MTGIQIEIVDGFAHIEFLDSSVRGGALRALLDAGGPGLIDVDTSGTRKTYIVPESVAQQAGLLTTPEPAKRTRSRAKPTIDKVT